MIYAHGAIRHGRSGRGPGPGGGGMGSDTVAAALRAAAADERARAVVLRVNSPGGSATASDVIWREVVRLRAAGKPVVVSMGDVAASGGYFISAPGRRDRGAAGDDHRLDRGHSRQAGAAGAVRPGGGGAPTRP